MSRIDRFEELLGHYEGREYSKEFKVDAAWEILQKIYGKEKLDQLDERSKSQFIEVYKTARDMSDAEKEPMYVDKILESIANRLNDENYKNPHAVAVWHEMTMGWLEDHKK
jgi:acyl-CoA hydrolase